MFLVPSNLLAQDTGMDKPAWAFRTRAVLTGVSDSSEPAGYKIYSGFAMEADLTRTLNDYLTLGWTLSTVSREVEFKDAAGKTNLGSIELLPFNVVLQFRLRHGGRFHPYVGAGLNVTPIYEKSGSLDSTDLTLGVGPTVEVGFDYDLSERMVFNVDVRAARLKTDLEVSGTKVATLAVHPATLGAGIGFRF
jgi:outer membrane protein